MWAIVPVPVCPRLTRLTVFHWTKVRYLCDCDLICGKSLEGEVKFTVNKQQWKGNTLSHRELPRWRSIGDSKSSRSLDRSIDNNQVDPYQLGSYDENAIGRRCYCVKRFWAEATLAKTRSVPSPWEVLRRINIASYPYYKIDFVSL